jgi:L-ascorbate metabolism protein UlaG (beta-lactamase superfamily)
MQGLGVHIVIDVELEMFALPHVAHPVHAQPGQRAQDRLTLRIEDLRFDNDVHDHSRHGPRLPVFGAEVARWTPRGSSQEKPARHKEMTPVQIVHFGQSCVLVETGTARLLLDPGVYSTDFTELTGLDAILITHQHPDHLDMQALPALMAANPTAQLLVDSGSAVQLASAGIAHQVTAPGHRLELAGTAVEVIGGEHGVIHPDIPVVPNNGYLIESEAGAILHPGDSFDLAGRDVAVLLLPTAAPWLKVSEAVDYLRAIAPPLAVPIHQAILAKPEKYYGLFRELAPAGTDIQIAVHAEPLKL